jgi:hypothetical protein
MSQNQNLGKFVHKNFFEAELDELTFFCFVLNFLFDFGVYLIWNLALKDVIDDRYYVIINKDLLDLWSLYYHIRFLKLTILQKGKH